MVSFMAQEERACLVCRVSQLLGEKGWLFCSEDGNLYMHTDSVSIMDFRNCNYWQIYKRIGTQELVVILETPHLKQERELRVRKVELCHFHGAH